MRKSATAVSLQPGGVRKPIQTGSIIIGLEGVLESYRRGKAMSRKLVRTITLGTFALVAVLCAARPGRAADTKTPYPSMAPLDQYLMDRNAESAMARSAAPEAISRDAEILVLGRHGYETAVKGKNGFVCAVERGWMGPFEGNFTDGFWNPKLRGPICYNPLAVRSILPCAAGVPRGQPSRTHDILTSVSRALDPRKEKHGESRACINAIRAATRERDELEVDAN
jgi:hypothetical protein